MSKKHVSELVAIGQKRSKLWRTPEGAAYADIILGGNLIACPVDSDQFFGWLKRISYLKTGLSSGEKTLSSAIYTLSTIAKMNGFERAIFSRVGKADGVYYLDLGHSCGSAIKYSGAGWEIVEYAPLHFCKPLNCLSLPFPLDVSGQGDDHLSAFYSMIGVAIKNRRKLTDFLCKCFIPSCKEPVLVVYGDCHESSLRAAEALKRLLDPFVINQLHDISSHRKLSSCIGTSRIVFYASPDSRKHSTNTMNCISQVSAGEGFAHGLSRPQILLCTEGWENLGIQVDAIEIQSVKNGLFESEFDYWAEFSIIHPEVLGALLDVVCDRLSRHEKH